MADKLHRVITRARTAAVVLSTLLTAPALLTGCGGGDTSTASSSASSSRDGSAVGTLGSSASATPGDTGGDGTDAPPFSANAEPDSADSSTDSHGTVRDLRLGRHDGFDRVAFEIGGTGTPGWDVRYVDVAASQGKGDAVPVAGNAILQVTLTGMGYPFDTGVEEYTGPDPLTSAGTEVVTEVVWDGTFEATSVAFVGTTARTPFRVYLLEDPVRVVVEIADAE
jgi:hypothetical protein